jgi:hypothetical protein
MKIATLELALQLAAVGQAAVALLNLNLVRLLRWQPDLARMTLLVRQVFQIHTFFISATLLIFAALTGRFAHELATGSDPIGRWLAGGIGLFWAIRAILQVAHYSPSHWRGIPSRTAVHLILLTVYSGWAVLYFAACQGGK